MASFAIEKLEASSAEVLAQIADRFRFMPENEPLCRSVLDRLEFLHVAVALNPDDKLRKDYADILVRLLRLLRQRLLLVRLAKSDTIVQILLDLHSRVDKIVANLELSGAEEVTHWKAGWQSHCTQQHEVLKEQVTAKSERLLVRGLKGDKEPRELLMALRMAVDGKQEAPAMLELKATTFDRVASYLAMEGTSAYDGFIAFESVEFEDEAIGFGTYGVPRRGSWVDRGQRQDVVVKLLFDETSDVKGREAAFLEQLHFWYNLPSDEHILKLYGGNHMNSPPFFVCEDAHEGNLFDFLYEDANRAQFWPMFLQLAKGLKFLHDRNIVHGGLKCNNALIGRGNVVKLTDFEFSCIRSLSLGLSENGGRAQSRAVRYQPKEVGNKLGNEKPKLESDMYALGMCIIEAFTREPPFGYVDDDKEIVAMIKHGELPSRPKGLSDDEWGFITSLCAEDYTQRPTVDEALLTIQGLVGATATSGFLVVGLHITAYSASVLDTIGQRIPLRMPESSALCHELLARLRAAHEPVASHQDDAVRSAYNKILVRFVRLLREKPLLFRLARSDTTLLMIRELHGLLDGVFVKIGEDDSSSWEENWEQGCIEQSSELEALLLGKKAFSLTRSFDSEKQLKEALLLLRRVLAVDRASPLHDLRQSTLDLVLQSKGIMDLRRYEWFISRDDVDYEDETIGYVGTFAAARRGSWLRDGQRQDVVVKTLFFDTDGQDAEDLLGQLVFWYKLPPHENVLKLLGGSHVSSPPFFVCEDAHNGNLLDFLAAEENRGHFWSLFLDVAKGLKHLHQQNIVHGGLKCTNILVGDKNTAKIADFGFSCVRSLSLRLSDQGANALSVAIRWKSKELLAEAAPGEPRFEADVYALGMCMIEAITQEIPFGIENTDDEVTVLVLHGQLPPRPTQAPKEVWDLICSLCAENYRARPSIDEVIASLSTNLENNTPCASAY
jgi:serine/threonine protein kinase